MKKIIQVETKTFDIETEWVGKEKLVRLVERGPGFQVQICIRERSAVWLCDCLLEAVNLDLKHRLLCSRKKGSKIILFHRRENSRGWYVLVSVLDEMGKGNSVVIPKGSSGSGWANLRSAVLEIGGFLQFCLGVSAWCRDLCGCGGRCW